MVVGFNRIFGFFPARHFLGSLLFSTKKIGKTGAPESLEETIIIIFNVLRRLCITFKTPLAALLDDISLK